MHKAYLVYPALILIGFLIINNSNRIYNFTESNIEITGTVYKVKESSYGYMSEKIFLTGKDLLYIRIKNMMKAQLYR